MCLGRTAHTHDRCMCMHMHGPSSRTAATAKATWAQSVSPASSQPPADQPPTRTLARPHSLTHPHAPRTDGGQPRTRDGTFCPQIPSISLATTKQPRKNSPPHCASHLLYTYTHSLSHSPRRSASPDRGSIGLPHSSRLDSACSLPSFLTYLAHSFPGVALVSSSDPPPPLFDLLVPLVSSSSLS